MPYRFYVYSTIIKEGEEMIDFNKSKTRKKISAIIIVVIIVAMVLTSVLSGLAM